MQEITHEATGSILTITAAEQPAVALSDTEAVLEAVSGDSRVWEMLSATVTVNDESTEVGQQNVTFAKAQAIAAYNKAHEKRAASKMGLAKAALEKTIKIVE